MFLTIKTIIVNGLVNGGIYAMLAVGFSLIFGVARILNMAHTAFYMVTAFLIYIAAELAGLPLVFSLLTPIVATVVIAVLSYLFLLDRVKAHENAVLIISLSLAILMQEILLLVVKGEFHKNPTIVPGFIDIIGVRVLYQHIFSLGVCLISLVGLRLCLTRTMLGKAIRAIADDRETANLMGINVSLVCMITMGISAVLAGVAAIAIGPLYIVHPTMWVHPLIMILAITVLGGIGSLKGSIIASFIIAFAETSVVFLIPGGGYMGPPVALAIMAIVLILKPEGLFGVIFEEERL